MLYKFFKKSNLNKGYTLAELVVVLAIVLILSGTVVFSLIYSVSNISEKETLNILKDNLDFAKQNSMFKFTEGDIDSSNVIVSVMNDKQYYIGSDFSDNTKYKRLTTSGETLYYVPYYDRTVRIPIKYLSISYSYGSVNDISIQKTYGNVSETIYSNTGTINEVIGFQTEEGNYTLVLANRTGYAFLESE